jgi:hypothetical protein
MVAGANHVFETQYFSEERSPEMENNLNCMDYSPKKRFRLEADGHSRPML